MALRAKANSYGNIFIEAPLDKEIIDINWIHCKLKETSIIKNAFNKHAHSNWKVLLKSERSYLEYPSFFDRKPFHSKGCSIADLQLYTSCARNSFNFIQRSYRIRDNLWINSFKSSTHCCSDSIKEEETLCLARLISNI